MGRVRNRDTDLELRVRSALHERGFRYRKHVDSLPGTPDVVFPRERVAVFVDGDFWHGYRFPGWEGSVSPFWQEKISKNRARDRRNFGRLRQMGWKVVRLWQHQIEDDLEGCVRRVASSVEAQRARSQAKTAS